MKHQRVARLPNGEWIDIDTAAALSAYSPHYLRQRLYRDDRKPETVLYRGKIYLRKQDVLTLWRDR